MRNFLKTFASDESGATAIEYGLIAAPIAVAIVAALVTLGGKLGGTFEEVAESLEGATS